MVGLRNPIRQLPLGPAQAFRDLSPDAPIEADGKNHTDLDHRRVSIRWLVGTILVGFAGSALIAAAVFATLDRQSNFAEAPQIANLSRRDQATGEMVNPKKADRLVKSVDLIAAKQTFKAPSYVRVGDKEVVKSRTYARIATNLSLSSTGYSDEVPAFNPLKLLAGDATQTEALPEVVQAPDEADVSFSTFDLNDVSLAPSQALLSADEIQAQVNAFMKSAASGLRSPMPIPPQLLLMRTSRAAFDLNGAMPMGSADTTLMSAPFSNIQVRMVPENVSLIAKTDAPEAEKIAIEKLVIVRRNERLEDILRNNKVKPDAIASIMAAFGPMKRGELPISEGQKLKMLFLDWDERIGQVLARLSLYSNDNLEMIIAMNDDLKYQQVAKVEFQTKSETKPSSDEDEEEDTDSIRLYDSFYETALKQDVPKAIINDLVRIFANDVDFQRAATPSDSFEVFYEESEEGDGRTELLYASITVRNETFKYYRYQAPEDTTIDFFDENGKSTRKFLIRKPIAQGEQRSGFGRRFHPILGYSRMHTGVDWSAPTGTPIVAAGNGTVIKAKRESGYGNRVEVQHPNGYITTYNHMSGFARGIAEGVRVRQGQVVGFLGMTGLATGPHLHYEVLVNGNFVDPMRIKLARVRELDGRQVAEFKRERDRIDELITRAPNAPQVVATRPR